MGSENQDKDGNLVITIEGALSAYEVADLKDRLLDGFTNHPGVVVDVNSVGECDTLGVQLLCSAVKTAEKMKKIFKITGTSHGLSEAVAGVGLDAEDYPVFFGGD